MAGILSLLSPASPGVNTAEHPVVLSPANSGHFVQLAGNLRICDGIWRTDYAWKELKGEGDALEQWQKDATQGAIIYNPRSGQGSHYLGVGEPRIVESAAGKLYTLTPVNDQFIVQDVSGGIAGSENLMLAWLTQAENYVIRTDGKSLTQIYDGKTVFTSAGYNSDVKDRAQIPNAAGPTIYAGGRIWVVLFDRRIYASNSLHQVNQYSAVDLLSFSDQTYDYLNVYFAPPADEGDIVALLVSINSGFADSRAQGEVMAVCRGPAMWGVALGIDRAAWPSTKMRQPRSTETAATGPMAFSVRDGDIIMRTNAGIESLNLLARERNTLGNPVIDLGADLRRLLERDDPKALIFASMCNPRHLTRMFCTLAPVIRDTRRYHMGFFSASWNPTATREPKGFSWEGIHTLPYKMGRVVMFMEKVIDGAPVIYALTDKGDGSSKGLVQFTGNEGPNVLEDGSTVEQEWFILTKKLSPSGVLSKGGIGTSWIRFDEARGNVSARIFIRSSAQKEFIQVRTVNLEVSSSDLCWMNGEKPICLGNLFAKFADASWFQILIKGTGTCSIDFFVKPNSPNEPEEKLLSECVNTTSEPLATFDPFYHAMP